MNVDEQPDKAIPDLQPPGVNSPVVAQPSPGRGLLWGVLIGVVVLLLVVLVLPKMVPDGRDNAVVVVANTQNNQSTEIVRQQAEQALQNYLRTRARLELANADVWGDPQWQQADETASDGERLFAQVQYEMSRTAFAEASGLLEQLESESGQRFQQALDDAWAALAIDDDVTATALFELALAIKAQNLDAQSGLQQALVRPAVLGLLSKANRAEAIGDLATAQLAYREILDLDPDYQAAQIALQSVTSQIEDIEFGQAISQALASLHAGRLKQAAASLQRAAGIRPDAEVVADTRFKLTQAQQKQWLENQKNRALTAEQDEDWATAVNTYKRVLQKLPQATFARRGLAFAEDRNELHRQLDHYLDAPTRLYSNEPLANAEQLLSSAGSPPVAETSLVEKLTKLKGLIIKAQTPMTVTLQSDGLTNVEVYHVGRLGRFTQKQLQLLPGTYTVVGRRAGYRDVRRTVTVKPGEQLPVVDIRSQEPV